MREAFLVVPHGYELTKWAGQVTGSTPFTSDDDSYDSTALATIKEYLEPVDWVAYTILDRDLVHEGYNFAPNAEWSVVVALSSWNDDVIVDVYMKGKDPGGFVQAEYGDIKILAEDLRDLGPSYQSACRALNYLDAICALSDEPMPEEPVLEGLSEAESEELYRVFYPTAAPYGSKDSRDEIDGVLYVTIDEPPSEKVLALFEDRNPGFTLLCPYQGEHRVVQRDDELVFFEDEEAAIREFIKRKIPCVWLPDFMEGEEADDGGRCRDGSLPRRLYLVWRKNGLANSETA